MAQPEPQRPPMPASYSLGDVAHNRAMFQNLSSLLSKLHSNSNSSAAMTTTATPQKEDGAL